MRALISRVPPSVLLTAAIAASALLCGCAGGGAPGGGSPGSQPASSGGIPATSASAPAAAPAAAQAAPATTGSGRTGCDLVTQSEASAAVGASLGAGHQAPYTPVKDIIAHSGCQFSGGGTGVGYDLNTVASSIPVSSLLATGLAKAKAQGATQVSVNGNPGFTVVRGSIQMVTFFRGHTSVGVLATNAKQGAALAIARLIADRM